MNQLLLNIRLKTFVSFVEQEFEYQTDILLKELKEHNIDVYDVLASYASFLVSRETFSSLSIKNWVDTTKNFLEFFDIDISPKKFKIKVRLPKIVRKSKEALTKESIVEILNAKRFPVEPSHKTIGYNLLGFYNAC